MFGLGTENHDFVTLGVYATELRRNRPIPRTFLCNVTSSGA